MRDSEWQESSGACDRGGSSTSLESMARLQAVLASIPDFVVILDRFGSITSVVAAESMPGVYRGISADEIVGRSILDFVSPGRAAAAL